MASSAFTTSPFAAGKVRLTFRITIFDFLGSMLGRLQVCGCSGNTCASAGKSGTNLAPGKQETFEECQEKSKQERGDANGDNAGVHAIEIEHFSRGFNHVTHALPSVQPLSPNYVSPADVVEDPEGGENRRERCPKH